jgi:hypothetical protein
MMYVWICSRATTHQRPIEGRLVAGHGFQGGEIHDHGASPGVGDPSGIPNIIHQLGPGD